MKLTRRLSVILLAIMVQAIVGINLAAADEVKIAGTVVDEYDKPVELALVRAENQAPFAISNAKGKFAFVCTPKDSLVIICSMIGYRTKKHVLQSPQDSVYVTLKISSLGRQLDEATVKAYRKQTYIRIFIDLESRRKVIIGRIGLSYRKAYKAVERITHSSIGYRAVDKICSNDKEYQHTDKHSCHYREGRLIEQCDNKGRQHERQPCNNNYRINHIITFR